MIRTSSFLPFSLSFSFSLYFSSPPNCEWNRGGVPLFIMETKWNGWFRLNHDEWLRSLTSSTSFAYLIMMTSLSPMTHHLWHHQGTPHMLRWLLGGALGTPRMLTQRFQRIPESFPGMSGWNRVMCLLPFYTFPLSINSMPCGILWVPWRHIFMSPHGSG